MQLDAIERILKPTTIEAINTLTDGTCEIVDPDSIDYRALTVPRSLEPANVFQFTRLLLNPSSWAFVKKRCLPKSNAVFRMQGNNGNVKVVVGITCASWIIAAPVERRGGFFDPVQPQVRELLKSIFPEYASPGNRSLWRAGIIRELKKQKARSEGGA